MFGGMQQFTGSMIVMILDTYVISWIAWLSIVIISIMLFLQGTSYRVNMSYVIGAKIAFQAFFIV